MKILIIIFFAFLVCLVTFPLVLNLMTSIYGWEDFPDDPLGTLWWIWWYAAAWTEGVSADFVPLVVYPFGLDWAARPISPLLDYPVGALNFVLGNEILTYNIVTLTGIFLSLLMMYLLVRKITGSISAGLLAAVIFGLAPDQLLHCGQHLGMAVSFLIPVYLLCLYRLSFDLNGKNVLLCSLVFSLLSLSNYYYGYFMGIFSLFWFVWMIVVRKRAFFNLRNLGLLTGGGLLAAALISPFIIPKMINYAGSLYSHDYQDLFRYAARWWDYFVPAEFHPLWGGLGHPRHYFERSLYLGYLPLSLVGMALVGWWRKKIKNPLVPFLALAVCLFFVFSLTPVFRLGRLQIPNLGFFAYRLFPMFRVYARMGVVVLAAVAILAALGLNYLLLLIPSALSKKLVAGFCLSILLLEYLNIPPYHNIDLSTTPAVYQWLARQPAETVIVEYPFVRATTGEQSRYLFYQIRHKKKMINGAAEGSLGDACRRQCLRPWRQDTAELLAYLGADYLIVHKEDYRESELARIKQNSGLILTKDFPSATIYRLTVRAPELIAVFWENFGSWEKWADGNLWRWLGNNATVWLGDKQEQTEVKVSFKITAFAKARELQIYLNDQLLKKINVPVDEDLSQAKEVIIKNAMLKTGNNIIRFYTLQGDDRIGDVLDNDDNRRVAFALSGFKIEKE